MPYQKVTMIEDLPELDQIDVNSQSIAQPPDSGRKLGRFIRQTNQNMPPESGMQMYAQAYNEDSEYGIPTAMDQSMGPQYRPKIMESYGGGGPMTITCQDVYGHAKECHICQRFYKTDNTMYIIIIAILIITCALLAKKVLNV